MPDEKDTDLRKPDGLIFNGAKIGHADKESRIRRRDGLIFKGKELGYVDRQKNTRKPDGIVFRGQVVGQVKGTAAHAQDGLIFDGAQWGYVDDDGNIRQRDGMIFKGRVVGRMRGRNKDAALGFFVLRFKELVDRFERLEHEARTTTQKGKYIGKVRHMSSYVPTYDGLGDFDGLIGRLKKLEDDLVSDVEGQRRSKVTAKESLIREAERWSSSSDWKTAGEQIKALQARWKEVGSVGNDEDSLWQRFRSACDHFFSRRSSHFEALDRQRSQNAARKEGLCSTAESLRYSQDMKAAVSQVKQLQGAWKAIGPAPKDLDDRLWRRFREACDEVFAAARREWERRQSERERKHEEWERKQHEWREKMRDTLRAKREQAGRLRESIQHDEGNISRWRDTIDNLHPGRRADEIRDSLEEKISDVEDRVHAKQHKVREVEEDIEDIEAKLRG